MITGHRSTGLHMAWMITDARLQMIGGGDNMCIALDIRLAYDALEFCQVTAVDEAAGGREIRISSKGQRTSYHP